jgi:hypothetical protein
MARITALLVLALTSSQAFAAGPWDLVWVSRSTDWFVRQAHGQLEQRGNSLRGTLASDDGTSRYSLNIKLNGRAAPGTFEVVPSDVDPVALTGRYEKVVSAGPNGCWETIWLDGGYDHVGLARNITCKP